ncbi:MAG: ribosome silencing factor [Bacillota bacterium]
MEKENLRLDTILKAISEKKGMAIKIVDVSAESSVCDYFVIASATNNQAVKALYDNVSEKLKKIGVMPLRSDGYAGGRWIAADYGDIVVHLFHRDTRLQYQFDVLWDNGENVSTYED